MATTNTAVVVAEDFKRDRKGRQITPKARREELVAAYRASGLTMEQFAEQEGINRLTLAKWSMQERSAPEPAAFAEMTLGSAPTGWAYEVTLPNGLLVRAANAPALVQLVDLIRK
jgi:transposase-like protein